MQQQYGLIGFPLTHSFSKKYFTEKFEKEGILNASYELFPMETLKDFRKFIAEHPELKGLNVTIPHKENVIAYLTELDELAIKIGAVNCIKIEDGKLKGYNTDAIGFRQSIKPFLETQHERALILGTGGASKAIHYVLNEIGIDCFTVTRDKSKLVSNKVFEYSELNEYMMKSFKLIVNCTPLGTFPAVETAPDLPYEFIREGHLLYDLVYNPAETEFLKRGKNQGAANVNGLSMLQLQAEEAWRIWNR